MSKKSFIIGFASIAFLFAMCGVFLSIAPADYPKNKIISIRSGMSLREAATVLEENHIIRSRIVYKIFVTMLGGSRKIIAANYKFDKPQSALRVAYRTINGIQDLPQIKVTIPEGIATSDVGRLLAKNIPNFDYTKFMILAKPKEGYLFPDTYYFYEGVTEAEIVDRLSTAFDKQIKKVIFSIQVFDRPLSDVIKMASIVEKEAVTKEDRRIVAGILWKRLDEKYPLQVDAPFFYALGKNSLELTKSDLASDFPYNTYVNKGLTPTPIGNPGLEAIRDTVNPIKTAYYFYLSDKDGNLHYAETHEGHVANKQKYLK